MMGMYLRSAVWDFVLTALAAVSLCYIVLDGFYIDPALQYSFIPALVVLACLIVLFAVACRRRAMLIGGVVYAVALFVVWIACAAQTPDMAIFVDFEQNYLIFSMVTTLTATLVFLVTRAHAGTAALFIVGAFLCGLIQLFYERFELAWTLLFVLAALALVIYRNYQRSIRRAVAVERVSFAPGFLVSLVACAVAVGIGVGVWYGIIAPLDPPAADVKLVTEYRALETERVVGTSENFQTPNIDLTSNVLNDGQRTTDDIMEDLAGDPWPATGETQDQPEEQDDNLMRGLDLQNIQNLFNLQSNPQNWPILFIPLVIIALIVLYFVLRRRRRVKRLEGFKALGPNGAYEQTFLFLLDRLRRVGITVPNGQTMLEFGVSSAAAVRFYDDESGMSFADLARGYSEMVYGKRDIDEEQLGRAESYYRGFWKACRKQLGSVKYFFKSFKL